MTPISSAIPSDSCFEVANEGNDSVFATSNYGLAADVENLILQGNADLQAYGNNQANVIYGNAGNNLINAAGGIDLMVGGAGNDTYFVDDSSDACFEVANEGNDAVFAFCHYGLAADVETLVLQGSGDFQGYGNNQANTLYGNVGNNLLNGAGGADTMLGGAGNDTYFVDNAGDLVFENANEGTDVLLCHRRLHARGERGSPGAARRRQPLRYRQCPGQLDLWQYRRQHHRRRCWR